MTSRDTLFSAWAPPNVLPISRVTRNGGAAGVPMSNCEFITLLSIKCALRLLDRLGMLGQEGGYRILGHHDRRYLGGFRHPCLPGIGDLLDHLHHIVALGEAVLPCRCGHETV